MIDLTSLDINFRGYPVAAVTPAAYRRLLHVDSDCPPEKTILLAVERMVDTAGPDEPSGWLFEARLPYGDPIWLERCGGVRDEDGHHGGHWVMLLPQER